MKDLIHRNMQYVKLFIISFVSLFMELLFIRWIPDSVHILSFFGNFTLLAVFLGLGIGLASRSNDDDEGKILNRIMINVFVMSIIIMMFDMLSFGVKSSGDYSFNEDFFKYKLQINIYLILSLFLFLTTYTFIPVGRMINLFFTGGKPLIAYSVNIGGSLLGIIFFSLLSYMCTPLWLWMAIALFSLMPFAKSRKIHIAVSALLVFVILISININESRFRYKKIWSPYYCMKLSSLNKNHVFIAIGNSFLLSGLDMNAKCDDLSTKSVIDYYELPYLFVKSPENVLILGSGMGNDVAYAIKMGAKRIDAVEIDPKIIDIGRKYHPNQSYKDQRVNAIAEDARSFTKNTKNTYDLIIFGTLDSHGLFSQMSSLKMENYVYTLESIKDAKKLLRKNGLLYINTGFFSPFVSYRLYNCIKEAFGSEPLFFMNDRGINMYLNGSIDKIPISDLANRTYWRVYFDREKVFEKFPESFIIPTDDWPHIFLKERKIPREYLFSHLILFLMSFIFIAFYFRKSGAFSLNYFFMGAGFMLLETKSITEMGLLFGATWIVNSIVIASILLIILAVNVFLIKYEGFNRLYLMYGLLGASLTATYFFPLQVLNSYIFPVKLMLAALFISLPIFFASSIFSLNFRNAGNRTTIFLASNMLGAVFGGIIEYSSMIYGLKFLIVFSLALYFVSLLAMTKEAGEIKMNP